MAFVAGDFVQETTTTTGTGDFTLAGAVAGCVAFSARMSTGDITFYSSFGGTQWEVGLGTLTAPTTLQRTTVLASSNGDATVNFASGTKKIFIDFPALLTQFLAGFALAESTVASAATLDLGAQNSRRVVITGTAAITSFGTRALAEKLVRFAGACTLTHDATALILPTAANIVAAAGDTALVTSDAAGNWRVRHYQRADGTPLTAPLAPSLDDYRSLAIQVAKLKGTVANLFGGVVDDFKDQSGIDTSNSTGILFDGSNNLIVSTGAESAQSLPAMTANNAPSGYIASANSVYGTGYEPFRAFAQDGGSTIWHSPTGTSPPYWLRRQNPVAYTMVKYAITGRNDGNSPTCPASWLLRGSNDGAGWTVLDTQTGQINWSPGETRTFAVANPGSYLIYELYMQSIDPSGPGYSTGGLGWANIGELLLYKSTTAAMDLRSIAFGAQAVPTKGSIYILVKATAGTLTPGTNFVAALSRDGGTTYTPLGLAQTGTVAGYAILEANGIAIGGQPSGSSMKWRIQTVGTALAVAVDAVVAQWG